MRRSRTLLAVFFLVIASASPLVGQSSGEAEIRALVERLFDGMRRGDSTAVRSVFHPEARLLTAAVRDGVPVLQVGNVDEFVEAVGSPHREIWDERIADFEVRVDDPLATAWMTYHFYLGDTLSHCGVNAFQLMRGSGGWKVIQITDTRRRGCTA